ncbi:NAD(P)-binding protein [Exidia glandulosa HHB12029]|uniref:Probable quinone oxidoreductase n=1 Tax=Exidia glandulosa HHB12029 TaxID=1314781 RepID=A0A166B7M6_EXIGL|nr:NAD(P)-binding protein [Exidia glandulosa HHB12029]
MRLARTLSSVLRRTMSTLPTTQRALQISEHGGPEVLQFNEVGVPQPSAGKIIVKVDWAGVNYIDNYQRSGLYPNKAGWPLTLGQEAAGTIVALPPSSPDDAAYKERDFQVGQNVAVYSAGAYTEYFSAPWQRVFPLPTGVDTKTAAAFTLQGLTVTSQIHESYEVKKGDTVLVHAAAGGLGLIYCQLLSTRGVRVIGTTSTKEKAALAKSLGAAEVLLYAGPEKEDIEARVLELTNGEGVHAVFDGVGKDTWELDFKVIRRLGTIVFVGNASGPVPPFPVLRLSEKNVKICRPTLVNSVADPVAAKRYADSLWSSITSGALKAKIHEEYPFSAEGLRKAHEDIAGRGTTGKLILKVA